MPSALAPEPWTTLARACSVNWSWGNGVGAGVCPVTLDAAHSRAALTSTGRTLTGRGKSVPRAFNRPASPAPAAYHSRRMRSLSGLGARAGLAAASTLLTLLVTEGVLR